MKAIQCINKLNDNVASFDTCILIFRVIVSLQLMTVHGITKIGIGARVAESLPNPFNSSESFYELFFITSSLVFPLFIIVGFYTRLAAIPILIVTLCGYFIVDWKDPLLMADISFMYSLSFFLIACCGPGKYSFDNFLRK